MSPQRIQRKRTRGWRMPAGAAYVGRPTKWGNPYAVGFMYARHTGEMVYVRDPAHAVQLYRRWLFHQGRSDGLIPELAGWDLACWCPLDQPCHADVLLEIANGGGA